jgi:GntR family transcriptional repressor for pyruvate dehydrogenase complex
MGVHRIRKAYEQVADQLLALIISGELAAGTRLPSEVDLAAQFGVSRTTVREALRILATHNLIESRRGVAGGHFVLRPDVGSMTDYLVTNVGLLAAARAISLENLVQARAIIEPAAAALAAEHRNEDDLEALRDACPADLLSRPIEPALGVCREFHTRILAATKNPLLVVAGTPMFTVIESIRRQPSHDTLEGVHRDHQSIFAAIAAGDIEAARSRMADHLGYMRQRYEPESNTSASPAANPAVLMN